VADTEKEGASASGDDFRVSAPQLSPPKGGGAIRGIGEKFTANPVNGTGSMSVPLFASPGRSGFGPQLSISYDSGAANGPFGFGWNLALPSITRKTDKGLPLYRDNEESDIFILSGAEDLMPALRHIDGAWVRDISRRRVHGKEYEIHRYRPRVEGLFARIERWVNLADQEDTFWRSTSRDNVTTWYGRTAESRIADPADRSRIFSWLICETHDDRGNAIVYCYKPEDSAGIDVTQAHERNRSPQTRSAQRYVKRIFYGNRTPYFPDLTAVEPAAHPNDWCFELVFDYGEHNRSEPLPDDTAAEWGCRHDPFSTYRSCFEVRTYRLCRRVLMFHHFPDQPNVGVNCLVRSTDLEHASLEPRDRWQPFYSYLLSVTQRGYVRKRSGGYLAKSLPPVEFDYTRAVIDETVREADADSLQNLPEGLDGIRYRWVDLDGEGVSGILSEQGGGWYYKPNLSPANQHFVKGAELTLPRFGPAQLVARQPVVASLTAGARLMDMSGDGMLDVVDYESATPGYYERTERGDWQPFRVFRSMPVLDWHNPNLTFVDLTGDGFPDLLISEDTAFWWHMSLSVDGFGPGQRVPQARDEEKGTHLIFADGTESIFLADMSGDGLNDLVRVRCGEVCYWPNLGYGCFGAKVTMDRAPYFDEPDRFDGRRIRLADIDGSGTADIVYFASDAIHLYFNLSGNAWGARRSLKHFPAVESVSAATVIDLLGNGTACLVWSSPLPGNAQRPLRYIDLMGGQKPHLLAASRNNMGAETVVRYAPSTRFYVADKCAGTPWLTRLPFPVHVVERVESYDYINRNRFTTRYAYHHGYYDGVEREFRGFGRVDQWDTEEIAALSQGSLFPQATNLDPAVSSPPVWTKTWYHTGAFFGEGRVSRHFQHEYYAEGDSSDALAGLTPEQLKAMLLDDTVLPRTVLLPDGSRPQCDFSPEELREACRALRGLILRQEVYALDGTDRADRPYSVSERNYTIEVLQPQGPNRYGVFVAHARESIDFHYERVFYSVTGDTVCLGKAAANAHSKSAADPRVTHAVTLAVDPYNNPLRAVSIAYGRRYRDPTLTSSDQARQSTLLATCIENDYTNPVFTDDSYRTPVSAEARTYELLQLRPDAQYPGLTNLLRFGELQRKLAQVADGAHDVPFENLHPTGLKIGQVYRRLIKQIRTYYRPDDLGASVNDPKALLPLGGLEALAIDGVSYQLALTPGLIQHLYRRDGTRLLPDPATVLGSTASDGGGYVDVDGDGRWWIPSGRSYFLPERASAARERTEALRHFFQARRFEDAFGNATTIDYDAPHDLLPFRAVDAVGNVVTSINDYRVLTSVQLTDPNGNRRAVSLDALGLVAGTAVMGKTTEHLGDSLEGFTPDLTQSEIDAFVRATDPHALAADLLGTATTRIVYDTHRFYNSRRAAPDDPSQWLPVFAASVLRETHVSDLAPGQRSAIQISFGYSDGFGREIQKKMQCEPGPLTDHGPVVDPRWVGTGWVIFNNKGKPVREYEPFFSATHAFEFAAIVGVSPVLFYDPLERIVATLHPNHTYDKVIFDPWQQNSYDVNDTATPRHDQTGDPRTDSDVRGLTAGYFAAMGAAAATWQTWYTERISGALGEYERDAALKAQAHADTPSTGYVDTLGRMFLKVMRNRVVCAGHPLDRTEEHFDTRVELDIEGRQLAVRDALAQPGDPLGRVIARYAYDMLGTRIYQLSMEANARWILVDTTGKPIRTWDSRGHNFSSAYDALRRPVAQYVRGTTSESDPRTLNRDLLVDRIAYGESLDDAQALNLRTRMYRHFDSAGVATGARLDAVGKPVEAFDFKGNPLWRTRRFVTDYAAIPDWQLEPQLEEESFESGTRYDALNRPIQSITPHSTLARTRYNVIQPAYNEASLLERVDVWLALDAEPGALLDPAVLAPSPVGVGNIDYDARGQRLRVDYKNDVATFYSYDRLTLRLMHLLTRRPPAAFPGDCPHPPPAGWPGCQVQNLRYAYDPIGNVTHIQDDAQQTIYFRNKRVEPSCDYTYDAVYRLIEGIGREHLGQGGSPIAHSYNDECRVGLLGADATGYFAPNDGNAMDRYVERYVYDAVDNILQMQHRGGVPSRASWTRHYTYAETSLIEDGRTNNRLSRTTLSSQGNNPLAEVYRHDAHGNMVRMPQLGDGSPGPNMEWDYRDQLCRVDLGGGGEALYVYDSSGDRVRKVRQKGPGLTEERIYLGGFEIFRKHAGAIGEAKLILERETLHVMDDRQRIALVETRTHEARAGDGAPPRLIRYQIANQLGSAILELDDQARIISYEEYSPYGSSTYQAVRSRTETPKRYRYTGKERDEESGLYYHGARYLAPWLGRWTACDPEEFRDGPNLYPYTSCNPVNLRDSTGRHEEPGHGAETYELALAAGFKEDDAAQLALATEGVDHDPAKVPTNAAHIVNGITVQWHFLEYAKALHQVEADIKKGVPSLKELGEHLHTLEDVGFKDAPGPHTRGKGPGLLNVFVAIALAILLIGLALVGAIAVGLSGGSVLAGLLAGVVFEGHAIGDFFAINRLFAGEFGLGSFGHPWRRTEIGGESTPISHVADELYQDPKANKAEFVKIFDLLKAAAQAKYKHRVASSRKLAEDAIARGVNADKPEKIRDFMQEHPRMPSGARVKKSYLEHVESEATAKKRQFSDLWKTKSPWNIGDIDITVNDVGYEIYRDGNTYQIRESHK
jgi:RHS repeat-associated protein